MFYCVGAALTAFVYGLTVVGFHDGVYCDRKVPRETLKAAKKEEMASLSRKEKAKPKVQICLFNARVNEHIQVLMSLPPLAGSEGSGQSVHRHVV